MEVMRSNSLTALALLALLALSTLAAAETSMFVPAVDANGKGIITTITARAVPGKGDVYISVEPLISVETQQSEKTAVKIAAEKAGVDRTKWDVFFKIVAPAESVDGPSGGAAMAVLAYAELAGKKPRRDLTVTGTIERDGIVGKIGGVLAKTEAVHEQGLSVFLVPLGQSVQDGVDLSQVAWERWKMTVVEVKDINEAIKIAFAPEGSRIDVPQRVTKPLELGKIAVPSSSLPMKEVAEQEITDLQNAYEEGKARLTELNRRAVEEALNTSRKLLENNYYYSAANTAFVTRASIETAGQLNITAAEFNRQVAELELQLNRTTFPQLTTENFEWVAGAQMRYYWARTKLADLKDSLPILKDPSFLIRDLASVKGWISASERLSAVAPAGGQPINEGAVREYAKELMGNVSELVESDPGLDPEAAFHLDAAGMAFNESRYLAATYDLYYAGVFYTSTIETKDLTEQEIAGKLSGTEGLVNETFTSSVWGQLFYAHSLYNLAEANRSGELEYTDNAFRLQELARGMSANRQDILQALSGAPAPGPTEEAYTATPTPIPAASVVATIEVTAQSSPDGLSRWAVMAVLVVAVAAVLLLAAFLMMRVLERRPNGGIGPKEALERMDELLVRGRISEDTYHRLRLKYERQLEKGPAGRMAGARKAGRRQPKSTARSRS